MPLVTDLQQLMRSIPTAVRRGKVLECIGQVVVAKIPGTFIGEHCSIKRVNRHESSIEAEVLGFRGEDCLLMPYDGTFGIAVGDEVLAQGKSSQISVGQRLIGRVIDARGFPLDEKGELHDVQHTEFASGSTNPLNRQPIDKVLVTGIRAIDGFTTLGKGQRIGLVAGSGVGKSALVSAICQGVEADVNVIALIGERGREVEEFVNQTLGEDGMRKSVIVSATAQESPLMRVRAAQTAIQIAEYFCQQGKDVFFAMDSVTRFAMAQREIGLAIGEPTTVKGYTPSVFSALPALIERCGNFKQAGSISALFTVLAESDDLNDPVVDSARAILDGHIVLSRELAEQGHYPAIDIGASISRLAHRFLTPELKLQTHKLRKVFVDYKQNKDVLELGLFDDGSSTNRQALVKNWQQLYSFLNQELGAVTPFNDTTDSLLSLTTTGELT